MIEIYYGLPLKPSTIPLIPVSGLIVQEAHLSQLGEGQT